MVKECTHRSEWIGSVSAQLKKQTIYYTTVLAIKAKNFVAYVLLRGNLGQFSLRLLYIFLRIGIIF